MSAPTPSFPSFVPSAKSISVREGHFVDDLGRVLHLRGANVSGASKVPNSQFPIDQHASASYIDRPFPLADAPVHWARLRSWGLTFIRINVTWDAIAHAGPGQVDSEYLAYLRSLLESLRGTGLVAYVSIHQDVWSRYSGGSGAPGWTLEVAGFDMSNDGKNLEVSGAAFLHGVRGGRIDGERGLWPTGYQKLASATMNTLFWGGDTFAPSLKVGSKAVGIQTFLQDEFLNAYAALVDAVGDLDTVMGFEMMNEPHPGYIGIATVDEWNYNTDLHLGQYPTPLQGMALGSGRPTKVATYVRSFPFPTRVSHRSVMNEEGVSAWSAGHSCPWAAEGVWSYSEDKGRAIALQEDYFTHDRKGRKVNFYTDYYFPFLRKWEKVVARRQPRKARMVEPLPNEFCPEWPEEDRPKNFVYAPHWYDLHTLFTKKFGDFTVNVQGLSRGHFVLRCLYWGMGVKQNYAKQIATLANEAHKRLGQAPIVIGECGIPIDMNMEEAFRTDDWKWQHRKLDALLSALEGSLVHFNLWTYNPLCDDVFGDGWNAEYFSWYSDANRAKAITAAGEAGGKEAREDAADDLDTGARLLDVLVRPYAVACSGIPVSSTYELSTALWTFRFDEPAAGLSDPENPPIKRVTELYLPRRIYESGKFRWFISTGGRFRYEAERERFFVWFEDSDETIRHRGPIITRRVDVWVREASDQRRIIDYLFVLVIVVVAILGLASEYRRYTTGRGLLNFEAVL